MGNLLILGGRGLPGSSGMAMDDLDSQGSIAARGDVGMGRWKGKPLRRELAVRALMFAGVQADVPAADCCRSKHAPGQ